MAKLPRAHADPDCQLGAGAIARHDRLARRRALILCIVLLGLGLVDAGRFIAGDFMRLLEARDAAGDLAAADGSAVIRGWARLGGQALSLAVIAVFAVGPRRRLRRHTEITNALTMLLVLVGAVLLASRLVVEKAIPGYAALGGIVDLLALHLVVCTIMPWSPREASLPFAPLLLVWVTIFLLPGTSSLDIFDRLIGAMMSPVILVPGAAIAGWRARRRHEDAERITLADRVESFGGELSRARIVHDAMFPTPFTGHIAFEYDYQPIGEIGGDYVHTHVCPRRGTVTLTLLDVAGHGLPAALTVNRLFGELERIRAEHAAAEPAEIMTLLNRYIFLTMAPHSLYATGACMMLDPVTGSLAWVNAGHPPAFVRRADGSLLDLATTTALLGVIDPDAFEPCPRRVTLAPGDVVIAFTDGAFEARDAEGVRFGIDRLRDTASFDPPPRSWPKFIAGAVARHHEGRAEDDVLIAALTLRSLRVPEHGERPPARTPATAPLKE